MRKHTPGRLLAYGLSVVAVAALAIAGAASGNHWADYNGTANTHELVKRATRISARRPRAGLVPGRRSALTEGGEYPSGNPLVKITGLDKDGGTLSWALLPDAADTYDVAAVVMKGGPNAMVYHYDAGSGGLDDSDTGITTPINTNGNVDPRPYGISHVDFCFDPKGGTGVKRLEVTKTADDVVGEGLHVGRREVRRQDRTSSMKTGETGTGQLEGRRHADRLRRAERRRVRDDHGDEPERQGRHRRDRRATRSRARSWTATAPALRARPAAGEGEQHRVHLLGAARLDRRRHEHGDRDGDARRRRRLGLRDGRLHLRRTRRSRSTRRSRPSTARTRGTASRARRPSRTPSSSAARARAGRTS